MKCGINISDDTQLAARLCGPFRINSESASRAADQLFGASLMARPRSDDRVYLSWLSEAYAHLSLLPDNNLGYFVRTD